MAVRIVLTLAAAGGMVVAAFLPWARDRAGVDVSIRSLWEAGFSSEARFVATVGFLVIVIGLLAILGLAPRSGWLTVLAGALAVATVVLFAIQLYRAIGSSFLADLGAGGWIALAAGIVAVIGGFFGTRPKVIVTEERAVRVP